MKSMTAYGRANFVSALGHFTVELHCVNRKHLEINTFLPKELLRYDADIKKWIGEVIGRGQVNVKIAVTFDKKCSTEVKPNMILARQLKSAWEEMAKELKIAAHTEGLLRLMANEEELFLYEDKEQDESLYRNSLKEVILSALQRLNVMKLEEGHALQQDIVKRFAHIAEALKGVAVKAPLASARFRERLLERLQSLGSVTPEIEERLLREVCIYAEKLDIAEELTRFESHLQQVKQLLESNQKGNQGIGKTLEFLIQELNREINTIGSKSSEVDISHYVIEVKTELERIREQIQNIE